MNNQTKDLIKTALEEDNAHRDVTTLSIIPEKKIVTARLVAKEDGIVCGLSVFRDVFRVLNPRISVTLKTRDGLNVRRGQVAARLVGPARSILTGERTALNFVQHLSGIATLTSLFVKRVRGTGAKIYDTRKTVPGMRELAKYAVVCGGGFNHRRDLSEMALIKDNHLAVVPDLAEAVRSIRKKRRGITIEVECASLFQVQSALAAGADVIMLDNMDLRKIRSAMRMIRDSHLKVLTEISGGVELNNVRAFAKTGVDRISVGALTHSAPALDLSIEFRG